MTTQTVAAPDRAKDWIKPAAMAIPKGGFFKEMVEQGRYGPIFPRLRRATASPSLQKSSPDGKSTYTTMPRSWRKQSQMIRTRSLYSRHTT